jgi:hypothetical protein
MNFSRAWVVFALALALHVVDEAAHDFLSVYNPNALAIRARYPFLPFPTFTYREFLAGLGIGIVLLLLLTPVARRGATWIRFTAVALGLVAGIANGMGHIVSSIYMRRLMPGVWSAPMIIVAGAWLIRGAIKESASES